MHTISRKHLNFAQLETFGISRCPSTVITANGEVKTHEEATAYVWELDLFLTAKNPRTYASSVIAQKALRGSRIFISGDQWSKHHVSSKLAFGYNAIRRTTYQSWSRVCRQLLLRQTHMEQHLQHHHSRKVVKAQHLFLNQLNVRVQMSKHGVTRRLTQPKT